MVEDDVLLGRLENVSGELGGLVDDLLAGLVHGHAAHRQRAAAVGAVAEGRSLSRVSVPHLDHVVGDAERVGDDLGKRGVVALAV